MEPADVNDNLAVQRRSRRPRIGKEISGTQPAGQIGGERLGDALAQGPGPTLIVGHFETVRAGLKNQFRAIDVIGQIHWSNPQRHARGVGRSRTVCVQPVIDFRAAARRKGQRRKQERHDEAMDSEMAHGRAAFRSLVSAVGFIHSFILTFSFGRRPTSRGATEQE